MQKISVILVIAGLLVALTPVAGHIYIKYCEGKMIEEWLNSIDARALETTSEVEPENAYMELEEAFAKENLEHASGVKDGAASNTENGTASGDEQDGTSEKPAKKASKQTVIGIIQIKKIKVKAAIVEGVSESNLSYGIGHIPGTAAPGEPGNCALAGHRSYTFGKFFNRLDKVEIGDEVIITTKNEDLIYEVSEIFVVKPDDTSVLKKNDDKSVLTLITCTPIYIASHRLIVRAELKERILKEP